MLSTGVAQLVNRELSGPQGQAAWAGSRGATRDPARTESPLDCWIRQPATSLPPSSPQDFGA